MSELKKYNTDALFDVPIITAGAADFKNGPTLAVGDCQLRSDTQVFTNVTAESVAFTSLSELPSSGDTIDGATSAASGTFMFASIESGTIGAGDAAGTLFLKGVTGVFQSENLNINGGTANVMTIGGDTTAGLVAEVGARNIVVALTAAEVSCKRGVIHLIDAAGAEWEDQAIHFSTYGHADAEMAVDFSDAVRFGLAALPSAAADAPGGLPISDAGGLDLDAMNTAAVRLTAARAQVLTDWINAGRLDAILDLILADTGELQGDDVPGLIGALNDIAATDIVTGGPIITTGGQVSNVGTVVNLTNLPSIPTNWLTAAGIAASALNGKGDWATKAEMDTAHGLLATEAKQDVSDANVVLILADTGELQTDWKNTGRLDTILDAIPTTAMRGTDGANTTVPDAAGTVAALLPTSLVGGRIDASMGAINGVVASAANLERSASTIVRGTATGTPTTTTMAATGLTESTDDHYNGRVILWTSGVLKDQATDITDYTGSTNLFTFTATTEAATAGDTFVVI